MSFDSRAAAEMSIIIIKLLLIILFNLFGRVAEKENTADCKK
jgi:hypothetical protein